MKAEIISVGNEVLSGTITNTNSTYLAKNLAMMGFEVHRQSVVGDVQDEIMEAAVTASRRSHVTILTGGLGPTKDDLTKESVAAAFGLNLIMDPKVESMIQHFYKQRGLVPTQNNHKQCMVINGGDVLYNANGTAPGIFIQTVSQAIILLPGPPSEMEPMFEKQVRPRLEALTDGRAASASLHVFGIGESALEEEIEDLLYSENPTAALYAKLGEVYIDIVAHGRTQHEAEQLLEDKIVQIHERVGEYIYSEDGSSLAETVVRLLKETKCRIALAESCTGGLMASYLTGVEGASKVFDFGIAAYSDSVKQSSLNVDAAIIKKFTSVSSATAAEMAKGARKKGKADIGIGITGEAGPTPSHIDKPVGLVYVAIADEHTVTVKKFQFGDMRDRATIREWTVKNAFDMVRRYLLDLGIEGSRTFGDGDLAEVERGKRPRKKASLTVQRIALQAGGILAILCLAFFGYKALQLRMQKNIYRQLLSIYQTQGVSALSTFRESNPDTAGWLSVGGTSSISNVVVRDRPGDEDYYRDRDFNDKPSTLGCLYLDKNVDLSDNPDNIIIYGNSSDPQQMFGPLLNYPNVDFLSRNYRIRFESLSSSADYRVIAICYVNNNPEAGEVQDFYKDVRFMDQSEFETFVIQSKMRSVINVEADILPDDRFLTLVTDIQDWQGARLCVIARRLREGEFPEMTSAMFNRNITVVYPQKWYELNNIEPTYDEELELDRWRNWLAAFRMPSLLTGNDNGGLNHNNDGNNSSHTGIKINQDGSVFITVNMNDKMVSDTPALIVSQIVAHELPAATSDEAIKALAVAVVTKLRYEYNHLGGEYPNVVGSNPSDRIRRLVESVIDQCVYYEDTVAFTPFFKLTWERTYSAKDVWGTEDYPYLKSVESRYDKTSNKQPNSATISKETVRQRLEAYFKITLSDDFMKWVTITSRGEGGIVTGISIDGQKETTGMMMMSVLVNDVLAPNFDLLWMDGGSGLDLHITSAGIGHGVGLSEYGADLYAAELGWDYKKILEHYYSGATIGTMDWSN